MADLASHKYGKTASENIPPIAAPFVSDRAKKMIDLV